MRYLLGFLWAGTSLAAAQNPEAESAAATSAFTSWPELFDPNSTVYALAVVFILTFMLTFYVGVLYFCERRRIKAAKRTAASQRNLTPALSPHPADLSVTTWQQRVLTAEALASNQALMLREKLMPELTEFVKQSLVQGLAAQRDALLAMQQQALQSLLEMETRLANLHAPLQERIRAYEHRIAELEKEISQQGAEMRELTRTILQLMRKKLDEEQEQEQTQPHDSFH
jgi:hypothetical protein